MNKITNRLVDNFISLVALQIISYVIPLITLPYLSRILAVDKFGLIFFAAAFMQYFIILIDFGFDLSATREIAVNRYNKNNLSNIFNSVIIIKISLMILSFIILCLILLFIPKFKENGLIFLLSFLMVAGNAIYPTWFFQGMEHMKYITFLNILSKTIFLILIFIFVKHQSDYVLVPLLNSLGFLTAGVLGFIFAVKKFNVKLYFPKINSLKRQFKYSSEFFISRLSVSIYTNTNTFCLGLVNSNLLVGYYVAAEKIYQAVNGLKTPLVTALYPFISKNKDIKLYKKIFYIALVITFFVVAAFFIFSKEFITIFYGEQMVPAYKVLKIFCMVALVNIPSVLLGYPLLAALGHTKVTNYSVIISSIFHIAGLLFLYLIEQLNIYSIVYLVFTTTCIELFIRLYFVIKHKLWNYRKGEN